MSSEDLPNDNDVKKYPQSLIDFEYQSLRQELLDTGKGAAQIFIAGLTATAAVIGYNISNGSSNEFVFLIPIMILNLVIVHILSSYYTVLNIATYIRIVLERNGKRWENWMYEKRKIARNKKVGKHPFFEWYKDEIFNVLRHHMVLTLGCSFIVLVGSLYWGCHVHKDSFKINSNLSPDQGLILFLVGWLLIFSWWLFILISSLKMLKNTKITTDEDAIANQINEWRLL